MPSQPTLRPFDIAVALRLLLVPEERYEPLANALVTSTSAVHRAVARLQHAGICRARTRTVVRAALTEFLLHGVRYAFPPMRGPERAGVPTALGHEAVQQLFSSGAHAQPADSHPLVWASELGTTKGESIAPLFAGLPAVATRDPRLHAMLAMVDALRAGTDRERSVVGAALTARIEAAA